MNPMNLKEAYQAGKILAVCKEDLNKLLERRAKVERNDDELGEAFRTYLLNDIDRRIQNMNERIQEQESIIDPVLKWAKDAPEKIRRTVDLRVLSGRSWAEISSALYGTEEGNTAYMAVKRFMDSN